MILIEGNAFSNTKKQTSIYYQLKHKNNTGPYPRNMLLTIYIYTYRERLLHIALTSGFRFN